MSESEALKQFKSGIDMLRRNYAEKALAHFTRALELDNSNPFYLSYQGVALAAAEKEWDQAEAACVSALRKNRTQAELYLNLAHVYRLAGKKKEAIETLTSGLPLTRNDARLAVALRKMGTRKSAVLPFLSRTNVVNRKLGKLRHRAWKSLHKEA